MAERLWPACRIDARPVLADDEVHVWSASLDQPPLPESGLYAVLTEDERLQASHYRFERDRRRSIASRGLLRFLLGHYLGRDASAIAFRSGAQGKLAVADGVGLHFNVAHSGGLALYAVARLHDVGVDVEQVRDVADARSIAQAYFAAGELAALSEVAPPDLSRAFLVGWTRKEAFVKAHGGGLSMPLDKFAISIDTGLMSDRVCVPGDEAAADWRIHHLAPAAGFVGALAVCDARLRVRCWDLRLSPEML